jgi:MFS family permease
MRAISLLGFHLVVQDVKPKFDRLPLAWRSHVAILFIARGLRGFGDGFAVVVLPAYLSALGYSPAEIGVLATVSLLGSALLTLAVGFLAPRHELRSMLLVGAGLMALTGVTFAGFPDFNHVAFVMIVGFVGTVIPSSGDVGVMVPLEHAMLAHEVSDAERTRTFARYSLTGALSIAAGALAAAVPDFLVTTGIGRIASFQAMFLFYAGLGLASAALYRCLPRARAEAPRPAAPLGPSRGIVYKLAALFSLDSFAGGFFGAVAAGAVAVRAVRSVAQGGKPVLLLVERADGVLLPGRGPAVAPHRAREHHGVHPHPGQRLPDPSGVLA